MFCVIIYTPIFLFHKKVGKTRVHIFVSACYPAEITKAIQIVYSSHCHIEYNFIPFQLLTFRQVWVDIKVKCKP